jgi:ATP-dependent DNA helicase DinG
MAEVVPPPTPLPTPLPTTAAILGPGGLLAQALGAWESRPQQLAMAEIVGAAMTDGGHAVVEAPTGVGKSFAHLVPAALRALADEAAGRRRPVVISTGTIALQEQLIDKDLPMLQRVLPGLRAVLVKGRQNYLSRRRLAHAAAPAQQQSFMASRTETTQLRDLARWSETSDEGDLADLGWTPAPEVWRQAQSDRNNCQGRKCPTYETCFFYNARRKMEDAHILVVNHHLYFSDISLRDEHAGILPPHDTVVFDEAHGLEDIATGHLGTSVSAAQIRHLLDGLWNRHGKGLLADPRFEQARAAVDTAQAAGTRFWAEVARLAEHAPPGEDSVRLGAAHAVEDVLAPCLDAVARELRGLSEASADDNDFMQITAEMNRCALLAGAIRRVIGPQDEAHIHFATVPRGHERGSPALSMSPLSVADLLKERLFAATRTVILTSATLAADDSDRFLFLRRRLGLEGGTAKRLDSPFDYQTQARLLLNRSPLDPNSPRFDAAVAAWLGDYLMDPDRGRQGGAFLLFTSFRQLGAVHDLLRPHLDRANRFVLRHGDGMGRRQMLELFRRTGDAVLFGTTSFWEGVDVPGDALRHVVIAKLPFEVPSHPVVEARHQAITRRGGNPFMERSVPEAILRLKQGFGRLIRRRTDTGSVVILDHRVLTKAYGRYFLRALPTCRTETFDLVPPEDQPR